MGFLGNLLTGGAGIAGANNAHLAELVILRLSASEKKRVAEKVVEMGMPACGYRKTTEQFYDFFNDHERLCQLNVIALALSELYLDPNVKGESWMVVRNPFALSTDISDLQTNASHFLRKYNLTVSVGTEKIDIRKWAKFCEPANMYSDPHFGQPPTEVLSGNEVFSPFAPHCTELQQAQALADQGFPEAQLILGSMYHSGKGVPRDYKQAMIWNRKAADQGNAQAQFILGAMYYEGQGVPQNNAQALMWFHKAADQGNADAEYNLGFMYENGQGVPLDYAHALMWYRKAADQGSVEAQSNLGTMYANGLGVSQDNAQAMMLFRKAADQGSVEAQCSLGAMYDNGQGVSQDNAQAMMWYFIAKASGTKLVDQYLQEIEALSTAAQVTEAQRMAHEWRAAHHPIN